MKFPTLLLSAALLPLAFAQTPAPPGNVPPFLAGDGLAGTGHSCNGTFRVFEHTLNYETSFTSCLHTPYKLLEHKGTHYVYRLSSRQRSCPFQVVVADQVDPAGAWAVSGFGTEASWRKDSAKYQISCPMF